MAEKVGTFAGVTSTPSVSATPARSLASSAATATPTTLSPPKPADAFSERRALPSSADHEMTENDESAWAATPGEGTSSRRCLPRGADYESIIDSCHSTGTAALDATGHEELGHTTPDSQPEEQPTKVVLLERTKIIFLLGEGRIKVSGGRALITVLTRRVLLDASEVINDFDVQRPEVQAACGQKLDAREGLAFLLGDVMLGARIPDEYARKLGDRLGKLVFGPAASLPKERTGLGRAHDKRVVLAESLVARVLARNH